MSDIEASFISAVQEIMPDSKFILNNRNGVEPKSVYCLVNVLSTDIVGGTEETSRQSSGKQTFIQSKIATIRCQFLGDSSSSSQNDAELLCMLFRTFNGRNALSRNGFSLTQIQGITRASVARDTKMYISSSMDLTLLYKSKVTTDQYSIDQVVVESTINDIHNITEIS